MMSTTLTTTLVSTTSATEHSVIGCGDKIDAKIGTSLELSFGLLIAILNIAEIVIIAKIRRKKKVYEILLLSLSASDCMFGLSNSFIAAFYIANACRLDNLLETAYTLYVFFVLTSIFHLLFTTVDRLVAVFRPIQYRTYLSRRRFFICIAILWIVAVFITAFLQILDEFTDTFKRKRFMTEIQQQTLDTTPVPNSDAFSVSTTSTNSTQNILKVITIEENNFKTDMQLALSVIIIMADFVMILSYSLIIYLTSFKKGKVLSTQTQSNRLPIICVAVAATFVLFTFPYALSRFAIGTVLFTPNFLLALNSGMNSIIYFFRGKISAYYRMNRKKDEHVMLKSNLKPSVEPSTLITIDQSTTL